MTDANCLFCKIVAGEIPADRVHEDDLVVAINDINPVAPVHQLLMPRRHVASAADSARGRCRAAGAPLRGRRQAGRARPGCRSVATARHQRRPRRWPVGAAPALPPHRRTAHGVAAGVMRVGGWLVIGARPGAARVGACTSPDRPSVQARRGRPAHAAALLRRLGGGDHRPSSRPPPPDVGQPPRHRRGAYRPSEPQSLLQMPRVVMRADLADPDDGYVVIYAAADGEAAARAGAGAGQTTSARGSARPTTRPTRSSRSASSAIRSSSPAGRPPLRRSRSRRGGLRGHRRRGRAGRGPQVAARPRVSAGLRRQPASASPGSSDSRTRRAIVVAGPGAHLVAADLERVCAREVGLRPQAPADDALVHREVGVGGLDDGLDLLAQRPPRPPAIVAPARPGRRARSAWLPGGRTTASMRPGSVSSTTDWARPWSVRAVSMSSG